MIDLQSWVSEDTWKVSSLRLSWTLIFQRGMCSQTVVSWLLVSYDCHPVMGPRKRPDCGFVQAKTLTKQQMIKKTGVLHLYCFSKVEPPLLTSNRVISLLQRVKNFGPQCMTVLQRCCYRSREEASHKMHKRYKNNPGKMSLH